MRSGGGNATNAKKDWWTVPTPLCEVCDDLCVFLGCVRGGQLEDIRGLKFKP